MGEAVVGTLDVPPVQTFGIDEFILEDLRTRRDVDAVIRRMGELPQMSRQCLEPADIVPY
jgi:hypothetical protein